MVDRSPSRRSSRVSRIDARIDYPQAATGSGGQPQRDLGFGRATWLRHAGADFAEIQNLYGHTDPTTTRIYAAPTLAKQRDAIGACVPWPTSEDGLSRESPAVPGTDYNRGIVTARMRKRPETESPASGFSCARSRQHSRAFAYCDSVAACTVWLAANLTFS